ncbi:MAG: hypothetical protein KAT15_23705, partial [Bacteroidales bacterium]|nr:hypothetical protein [Bacteroidales bacterium]
HLQQFLTWDIFSYANVPYRIKPYSELLNDPRDTIEFDLPLEQEILKRVEGAGTDGKLVWGPGGSIIHVNMAEKLLVTLLSKLSNFIPGAGIWMNTQRPEWNDANNALVGYGVSMVTTYYLRAYMKFCRELFKGLHADSVSISEEVASLLDRFTQIYRDHMENPESSLEGHDIKACMDALGQAGSEYRQNFYKKGFTGGKKRVSMEQLAEFLETTLSSIDITIASNRRSDKLFHSYNLIQLEGEDRINLRRLYEMLEGQVAVLGSGYLSAGEAVEVLDTLKGSSLFREDQYSYILYPDRRLPSFVEKNNIAPEMMERSRLLKDLIDQDNRQIVVKDVNGDYHFNGNFRNASMLKDALENLPGEHADLVQKEIRIILDIFEEIFDHQSFTGRSGTFYGYEGLGSIYWHMVSKLLLAASDTYYKAHKEKESKSILGRLADHYYEIRAGIGLNKDPDVYGAFPTDPYSHTPGNR